MTAEAEVVPRPPPTKKTGENATLKGFGAPKWQYTHTGPKRKHKEHGYDMVWCAEHKSPCGTVQGMYMKAPHNHEEWALNKKKRRAEWKAKKDAEKKSKGSSSPSLSSSKSGTGTKPNKLTLAKSVRSAFCTQFQVAEADVDEVLANVMSNYDADEEATSSKD